LLNIIGELEKCDGNAAIGCFLAMLGAKTLWSFRALAVYEAT